MNGSALGNVTFIVPPSGLNGNPLPLDWIAIKGLVDEFAVATK